MIKRESGGGYTGGSTVVSPKDPSWFSKGSTRPLPKDVVTVPPQRSPDEQRAYDAFTREATEPKYALIKRGEKRKNKKTKDADRT